ncbi:MAG: hypothetical protein HY514_02610 [Candidatus Aenigmarchaeota archaeon]|nr:hypothetical protein [Candidatus Aenigmarchaeota archaeon]
MTQKEFRKFLRSHPGEAFHEVTTVSVYSAGRTKDAAYAEACRRVQKKCRELSSDFAVIRSGYCDRPLYLPFTAFFSDHDFPEVIYSMEADLYRMQEHPKNQLYVSPEGKINIS